MPCQCRSKCARVHAIPNQVPSQQEMRFPISASVSEVLQRKRIERRAWPKGDGCPRLEHDAVAGLS